MVPPGGYTFRDSEGMEFHGTDEDSLVSKVIAYRKRINKPVGDPRAEVVKQICGKHPRYCRERVPSQRFNAEQFEFKF